MVHVGQWNLFQRIEADDGGDADLAQTESTAAEVAFKVLA